jgi:hypothetical protein
MKVNTEKQWEQFTMYITKYISEPRRERLLELYSHYSERIKVMPASIKAQFHSAFEGGYVYHVINVIELALKMELVWKASGVNVNWTTEELIFAAINHDLGKVGDESGPQYIPNDSQWHIKNRGELYKFNTDIPFMEVHDRSLFILQEWGIPCTYNETLAIRLHGGLWDKGTEGYLSGYNKPKTALPYILHQADLTAARIEFEQQFMFAPKEEVEVIVIPGESKRQYGSKSIQNKVMASKEGAENLKNILKGL